MTEWGRVSDKDSPQPLDWVQNPLATFGLSQDYSGLDLSPINQLKF